MPVPNCSYKYGETAYFDPQDFVGYAMRGRTVPEYPKTVIIVFSRRALMAVIDDLKGAEIEGPMNEPLYLSPRGVGFGWFGVGAPIVATAMEEMIALGVKRFIAVGMAGGLDPTLVPGDVVVCTEAVRDEGTSYHYLRSSEKAHATPLLAAKLYHALHQAGIPVHIGPTWTTDAPYRETVAEVERYASAGIKTVEMEASAMAAVALYRQVEFAAAFVISDLLTPPHWQPHLREANVIRRMCEAARAVAAFSKAVPV